MQGKHFVIIVEVEPVGYTLAQALENARGEAWTLEYLRAKMPAGSPVTILSAHEVGVETVLATRRDDDPAF